MQDTNHLDINLGTQQPSGLGGWLILPSMGLLVSPLLMAKSVYDAYSPLMSTQTLALLANTQLPSHNPRLLPVVGLELLVNIAFILFTLTIIPKFFKKQASVPTLMAIWYAVPVAIHVVDIVLTDFAVSKTSVDAQLTSDAVKAVLIAAVWIPYFMRSIRVKNTFGQNAFGKTSTTANSASAPA
ncbi:DUF2569 domain-containing protein [Rhodoferax saidenbachensis]|uniref:DUF2569 domain-containing protein n=1 Tax=Rhodoferax saidenbachensis TaxID=1484693 RepID=A0ABU1ZP01_9BURK|nr:DUF2569 domain-containing protein [Rhodoferax saidenbachensis]MDR7307272.1 hypothetical protein [Rhodoferax saidenbachensis]